MWHDLSPNLKERLIWFFYVRFGFTFARQNLFHMGKDKLRKWAENETFDIVFEPPLKEIVEGATFKQNEWGSTVFGNDNPITLELGCGKGEYTLALAKKYPERNFIGVDVKGHRFWRGAKTSIQEEISNVAFLRTRIEFVHHMFGKDEVSEIWLTFSDPQKANESGTKRITSYHFWERYKKFLRPDGIINIKTDSPLIYKNALEEIKEHGAELLVENGNIYEADISHFPVDIQELLEVKTYYEQMWLAQGDTIKYIQFKLNR